MVLKRSFDYKWVMLVTCFLMEFICLGFCSSNAGLYTIPITEALDIPRSVYSFNTSIRYIVQVFAATSFGTVTHRFGLKKPCIVGMIGMVASVCVRAVGTQFYHFYIASALLGFSIVFVGGTMAGTLVRRWFHHDVGRYTGIAMSANGIGGAVAAQIITPIINNGETFGYRKAYILSAIISLCVCVAVLFLFKERPSDSPELEKGKTKKKPRGEAWVGIEYSDVKRKVYFYIILAMTFLTGIALQSVGTVTIAHMTDMGISSSLLAIFATLSSLILTVAKFFVGFTYDKKGLSVSIFICHFLTVIGFAFKALLNNSPLGIFFAFAGTCCTTFAMPLETVMIPLIANDIFGTASYNKVLGMLMAMNSLGLCLGAPLGDIYHDKFGTYIPVFWFFFALIIVVTIGFQIIIRIAHKDKEAILAEQTTEPTAEPATEQA